jgi:hypothetical protein
LASLASGRGMPDGGLGSVGHADLVAAIGLGLHEGGVGSADQHVGDEADLWVGGNARLTRTCRESFSSVRSAFGLHDHVSRKGVADTFGHVQFVVGGDVW